MSPDATGDLLGLYVAWAYLLVLALVALPSITAFRRHDPNRWVIRAFNASGVGSVVALALAVCPMVYWGPSSSSEAGAEIWLPSDVDGRLLTSPRAAAQVGTAIPRLLAAAAVAEIERRGRLRVDRHLYDAEFAWLKTKVFQFL